MQTQIKYCNQRLVNLPRVLESYLAFLNSRVEMIAAAYIKKASTPGEERAYLVKHEML